MLSQGERHVRKGVFVCVAGWTIIGCRWNPNTYTKYLCYKSNMHSLIYVCAVKWDKVVIKRSIPPLTSNLAIVNLFINLVSGDLREDNLREPQLEQAVCTDVYTVPMGCELNIYSPPTVFQGENKLKAPFAIATY